LLCDVFLWQVWLPLPLLDEPGAELPPPLAGDEDELEPEPELEELEPLLGLEPEPLAGEVEPEPLAGEEPEPDPEFPWLGVLEP
jgi:hypothetical protein